ncbi:MAG TPA: hypothetical protein V6D22_05910 [Candidatus Obscuribacterales bacterium]
MRVELALTLLAAVLLSGSASEAQQTVVKKPLPRYQPPAKALAPTMKYQRLIQPPNELPAMTQVAPPGGQYLFGTKNTADNGVTQVELRWSTTADANSIMQVYNAQFSQPGWKSIPSKDRTSITGMFNKNVCTVQIMAPSKKNMINDVQLTYQFLER